MKKTIGILNIFFIYSKMTNHKLFKKIKCVDNLRGEINTYFLQNSFVYSESINYPVIEFKEINSENIISPIFEKTMSLSKVDYKNFLVYKEKEIKLFLEEPVFFLCYNFDNYYHFIYDTLPYLVSFFELKKEIDDLKILIPNINLKKFVLETFDLLDITENNFIKISDDVLYSKIYYSDSLTHGDNSNLPPHKKSYEIYDKLIQKSLKNTFGKKFSNKLYISRRTWVHNNLNNLGTDYTSRRKLVNENELVRYVRNEDFEEIFTENLPMDEKISLFNNADFIIGPIGGGLVNCIFCKENCKLLVIESPTFFEVNQRFKYSFFKLKTKIFQQCKHLDDGKWKKYQRVYIKKNNLIGEIIEIKENEVLINYTDKLVSGFSNEKKFNKKWFNFDECESLDNGLNSPFIMDLEKFKIFYESENIIW